ncbi:hypothetical protein Tco_1381007 [Tanacetum coccineum]
MTTTRTRAVVSKGKVESVLKKDKWGNLEILLQDHAVVDSGCSSHMIGNKETDIQEKDKKKAKNNKTEHGMEKTKSNRSQSQKSTKWRKYNSRD